MILVASLLCGAAALLCLSHYAAVTWPSIANQPDVARPLRLDRPDSFGRWFMVAMLAGSAGASLLIYQLRRYRIDDFQGRYRLWRLVLVVLMLASVNSLVSIIDWSGALLDAAFGKRVALTGGDWIRLVVSIGGAVLAIRLIAEVRRSRYSLGLMISAFGFLAVPEAANWNVLSVETLPVWTVVTCAPLLAYTALFISLGVYLRMLYREVRQIEDTHSLKERFHQMRLRVFKRSGDGDTDDDAEAEPKDKPQRGPLRRRQAVAEPTAGEPEVDDLENAGPHGKRRWFGLRRAKAVNKGDGNDDQAGDPSQQDVSQPSDKANEKSGRSWFRRKQKPAAEPSDARKGDPTPADKARSAAAESLPSDPEEIDWDSLSKSERRRLRKQLKRKDRAA